MPNRTAALDAAAQHAKAFLETLDGRPVSARVDAADVREPLGGPVPEHGEDPTATIDAQTRLSGGQLCTQRVHPAKSGKPHEICVGRS